MCTAGQRHELFVKQHQRRLVGENDMGWGSAGQCGSGTRIPWLPSREVHRALHVAWWHTYRYSHSEQRCRCAHTPLRAAHHRLGTAPLESGRSQTASIRPLPEARLECLSCYAQTMTPSCHRAYALAVRLDLVLHGNRRPLGCRTPPQSVYVCRRT